MSEPITSKRFAIRSTRPAERKENNRIVFGTGEEVPFMHTCELFVTRVSEKELEYVTGLEVKHIKYSKDFPDEDKEALLKHQAAAVKKLAEIFGKDTLKPTNGYFWEEQSSLKISNETLSMFFDTKEPAHLLLYWKIMGGGYSDEIAPSFESAAARAIPFYLTEFEEEAERRTEVISKKIKAFALLEELNEKRSQTDMLWLAWMLHPSNMGYTYSTPKATLYRAHYEFIEGMLVKSKKKSCAAQFVDAVTLLNTDKTKAIALGVVHAAEYFGLLYSNKDGKFQTRSGGTLLGQSFEEAIEILLKPANQDELEELRIGVEEKLK